MTKLPFILSTGVLMALITGCAPVPTQPTIRVPTAAEATPLMCTSKQDCDAMWSRAVSWANIWSGWKVQVLTDVMLQTFGPTRADWRLAITMLKEVQPDGSGIIRATVSCGQASGGCAPDVKDAVDGFTALVGQIKPKPKSN